MDAIVSINEEHNQYVELVKARIGENHEAYWKENEALNRAPKRNKKRNLLEECWVYVREFCMEDDSAEKVCSVIIRWSCISLLVPCVYFLFTLFHFLQFLSHLKISFNLDSFGLSYKNSPNILEKIHWKN